MAIRRNIIEKVEYFLNIGANPDVKDTQYRIPILILAALQGKEKIVEILFKEKSFY